MDWSTFEGGFNPFTIIPLIFIAYGVWSVGSGFYRWVRDLRLTKHQPVRGEVISSQIIYSGSDKNRSSRRVETVEYQLPDGRVVRGTPLCGASRHVDRTGMIVPVHLDPARPDRFRRAGRRPDQPRGLPPADRRRDGDDRLHLPRLPQLRQHVPEPC